MRPEKDNIKDKAGGTFMLNLHWKAKGMANLAKIKFVKGD